MIEYQGSIFKSIKDAFRYTFEMKKRYPKSQISIKTYKTVELTLVTVKL